VYLGRAIAKDPHAARLADPDFCLVARQTRDLGRPVWLFPVPLVSQPGGQQNRIAAPIAAMACPLETDKADLLGCVEANHAGCLPLFKKPRTSLESQ